MQHPHKRSEDWPDAINHEFQHILMLNFLFEIRVYLSSHYIGFAVVAVKLPTQCHQELTSRTAGSTTKVKPDTQIFVNVLVQMGVELVLQLPVFTDLRFLDV